MKTFPIDLMTLTQHIHTQYEKVLSNKSFAKRMCYCRKQIFERFTYSVEKLIIKLGARTLKYTEDFDLNLSSDIGPLYDWFTAEVYDNLYNDPNVSNKMILTFQLMQRYQDKKFFDIIQIKYENILIGLKTDNIQEVELELNELFEEIRAWFELFLYMILSTQFNCQSLSDKFLADYRIIPDFGTCETNPCDWCIHYNDHTTCDVHEGVLETGETINIIMVNDFIDDMTWMDTLIHIVSNYHVDPSVITFNLDYRMYDQLVPCKLSHIHYDNILQAEQTFVDLHIKNHEGINFNGYHDKIKHLLD